MMSKKFVKVLCIILALLMVLTSVTVLVSVFSADALDGASIVLSSTPRTGEDDLAVIIPVAIAVIAVVAIVVCVVLPKFKKKQSDDEPLSDD